MYIEVNHKKINYEMIGTGETIFFVHGWGGTIESLRKISDLASKNFRTVVLDLPGFGKSDDPDSGWGIEEYGKLLKDFLQKLKIDNIIYFGHSFGGSLGIYLASHYTTSIKKLILCNSAYKRTGKVSKSAKLFNIFFRILPLPAGLKLLTKKVIYKIFFPNSDLMKFPHLEPNFKKIMTQDMTSYLEKIKAPTLILWGKNDQDTPLIYAEELKSKIKNAKLLVFPDANHSLPLKEPKAVYEKIHNFLK